jgi:hypothetical protein
MRLPRFRIWVLMLIVALAALGSAALVLIRRSTQYSMIAAEFENRETTCLREIEDRQPKLKKIRGLLESAHSKHAGRPRDPLFLTLEQHVGEYKLLAESARAQAIAYRRAARYPWLGQPDVKPASK